MLLDARPPLVGLQFVKQAALVHAATEPVQKQFGSRLPPLWIEQQGPGLVDVFAQPIESDLPDRNHPLLSALAMQDRAKALGEVDVRQGEAGELLAADAGGIDELQKRPVPQASGAFYVGRV